MPELPEVESTAQVIAPLIIGKRLSDFVLFKERLMQSGSLSQLVGSHVTGVTRRGKYLLIFFMGGKTLCIHFVMTGRLSPEQRELQESLRLVFEGTTLYLTDSRNWAKCWVLDTYKLLRTKPLAGLGVDAMDYAMCGGYLYQKSRNRTEAVKEFLMDQSVIAGVGNIYANEVLFSVCIDPAKPAMFLSEQQYDGIVVSLKEMFRDYTSFEVRHGWSHSSEKHKVYGREGAPCPICGTPIMRSEIAKRGTFRCPHCQL